MCTCEGREHRTSPCYLCRAIEVHTESERVEDGVCHCGQPFVYGFDDDPTHTRGMCSHCDAVRCDAYPGECGRGVGARSA